MVPSDHTTRGSIHPFHGRYQGGKIECVRRNRFTLKSVRSFPSAWAAFLDRCFALVGDTLCGLGLMLLYGRLHVVPSVAGPRELIRELRATCPRPAPPLLSPRWLGLSGVLSFVYFLLFTAMSIGALVGRRRSVWVALGCCVIAILWARSLLTRRRAALALLARHRLLCGQCPRCGYDVRATPEKCPECGAPVEEDRRFAE